MGRRSKRDRELELFNFSFLDILACVIGLLIFILSIVAVSGGGATSRQTAARLSRAEHQVQQATVAAQMAADRRARAEQFLSQQSQDFSNPKVAAAAVRAQIALMDAERNNLDIASATDIAKQESLEAALSDAKHQPAGNPSVDAIQKQLRELDTQTAEVISQTAEAREKAKANVQKVQYYVPHVREVVRRTLWVEVSGDRMWCVMSDDYTSTALDADSTSFTRRVGASGTSISGMVAGKVNLPSELSSAGPEQTVLEIALHSDGNVAFRQLRQWAWSKGYSVNWVPQDDTPIVLTRTSHVFEQ